MSRDQVANSLFGVAFLLAVGGLLTLVPFSAAKVNGIGYHSMCPFAPWSSLGLLVAAGVAWVVRSYVLTRA
jgi:hypothetical protein